MTIRLPQDVERDILAEVHRGRFASIDDALATAWRSFQRQEPPSSATPGMGSIGAMREDADFLDEIVKNALKARREQPWRLPSGE
jgi:Arc/MetJ-type ribon-helix-helix transcriptional regulator